MADQPHRLSKSRFMGGLQCHRLLWWASHEPDAPELVPGPGLQAIFDQGTEVGELARTHVPGGTLIDAPHRDFARRLAQTTAALAAGARVLYEASFVADGVFVAADILAREGDNWTLIEVKSTTSVKPGHVEDAAVQTHVLRASGLTVGRVELMHLNRACVYPALGDLFRRTNVTEAVEAFVPRVPGLVREQEAVLTGPLPRVDIGPHCTEPHDCAFRSRCWENLPEHFVTETYFAGRKAWEWRAAGYETVLDLPDSLKLNPAAERQRRALREGRRVVEPGIAAALASFAPPLAVLDFETVNPAVPRWSGCSPYTAVPVQFSVQRQAGDAWSETGWIAARGTDPRPACAQALLEACAGARTVLAYNSGFEKMCVNHLADSVPEHAGPLRELAGRLADLLPVVRDHVYDPRFRGSFSIKRVLPALVPGAGYEGLEINDGAAAARELARVLFSPAAPTPGDDANTRTALREYCAQDTRAVVQLLEVLRGLA